MNLTDVADRLRKMAKRPENHAADWYRIKNADDDERAEVWIYGIIGSDFDEGDVTAATFTRELRAITAPAIDLHINSPGGLVWDGVAIYSALLNHPAAVSTFVDGVAASAASFVAQAGDTVTIEKPASMMIHDARGLVIGNAADMTEFADLLNQLSDQIAGIYADRAGGTAEQWRESMRAETWYTAAEAVEAGLAHVVANDSATASAKSTVPAPAAAVPAKTPAPALAGVSNLAAARNTKVGGKMSIEEILAAMKEITDAADGRNFTDDEFKAYEKLENQLATERSNQIRERQERYESPAPDNARIQAAVHVAPSKKDSAAEAFNHYLRTGKPNSDLQPMNAQSVGTDSEGGFTAPEEFRQKLVDRLVAFGGLATEVEVITTDTGNRLPWPTLDDTSNQGVIAAEGAAPASGGADLVFGERELNAFRYVAPGTGQLPLRVSVELLQDSAFDIEELVIRKLGERIARRQAVDWVTGAGTTEPEGIDLSTGPSQVFVEPAPTKDELIDAVHSVDPAYRMNAIWVFNDAQLAQIRKIEDANGRPLWLPLENSGLINVPGGVLLGHRVVIDQAFATSTAAGGETWGVFGDVREGYVIRRVRDVQVIVNPWTRANEGQVEYTLWARADGAIQNPNSFALLQEDGLA